MSRPGIAALCLAGAMTVPGPATPRAGAMTVPWPATPRAGAMTVPGPGAQQVFRGGTDTVSLSITVVNAAGHFVTGLGAGDFEVFEDGIRQDITAFAAEAQPVALSVLLDSSTSMEMKMAVAQQAAAGFVKRIGPFDLAQVIDFDNQATVVQPYTADADALQSAVRKVAAGGSTALYDALYLALREPAFREAATADQAIRRWAIVVLSDGEDTSSRLDFETILDTSKRSDFTIYAVGLRAKEAAPRRGFNQSEYELRTLSQETGGRVFFVDDENQLAAIYQQIAEELANQYIVGYTSKNVARDGKWRRLQVRVAKPEATARTRAGYFGPKGSSED